MGNPINKWFSDAHGFAINLDAIIDNILGAIESGRKERKKLVRVPLPDPVADPGIGRK